MCILRWKGSRIPTENKSRSPDSWVYSWQILLSTWHCFQRSPFAPGKSGCRWLDGSFPKVGILRRASSMCRYVIPYSHGQFFTISISTSRIRGESYFVRTCSSLFHYLKYIGPRCMKRKRKKNCSLVVYFSTIISLLIGAIKTPQLSPVPAMFYFWARVFCVPSRLQTYHAVKEGLWFLILLTPLPRC